MNTKLIFTILFLGLYMLISCKMIEVEDTQPKLKCDSLGCDTIWLLYVKRKPYIH
jgi:hypothetical protein